MIRLLYETNLDTPIGELGLLADDTNLLEISFKGLKGLSIRGKSEKERFKLEIEQLDQYFSEKRKSFTRYVSRGHLKGRKYMHVPSVSLGADRCAAPVRPVAPPERPGSR